MKTKAEVMCASDFCWPPCSVPCCFVVCYGRSNAAKTTKKRFRQDDESVFLCLA